MPEAILRFSEVSCALLGDGEKVFPLLLERISEGEPFGDLPGIAYLDHEGFNSTPCPGGGGGAECGAPDYGRWVDVAAYSSQLATAPLQTKLGCAFQCVYCTYRKIEGNGHRLAEPASVADAVTRLAASGLRDIELVDSVFNAPYDHARAVCDALAGAKHLFPRIFDTNANYIIKTGTHAGKIFYNRGEDAAVYGVPWIENSDNPASLSYVFRIQRDKLPLDGKVYEGLIDRDDVLIHESEIGEKILT